MSSRSVGRPSIEVDVDYLYKLYLETGSLRAVSKLTGISHQTIMRRFKEAGKPLKKLMWVFPEKQ